MAVGDIVVSITDIATVTDLDFQPASGVEVMLTLVVGGAGSAAATFELTNGTLDSPVYTGQVTSIGFDMQYLRAGITNSVYLRQHHNAGSNRALAYTGVQVK